MPQWFTRPAPVSGSAPPTEAPNRPIGQDWLSDAVDVILAGIGVANPFDPAASKATQIGGMVGAALPILGAAKLTRGAQAAKPLTLADAAAAEQAAPKGIRAFHGSPHDFDKFSMEKIGTGEGAQAYGHGLYFADAEQTALNYRNALSPKPAVSVGGRDVPLPSTAFENQTAEQIVANRIALQKQAHLRLGRADDAGLNREVIDRVEADINSALDGAIQRGDEPVRQKLARQRAELGLMREHGIDVGHSGRMYEVNIKADPDHFLDWDKPLSQQSPQVQRILRDRGIAPRTTEAGAMYDPAGSVAYDAIGKRLESNAGAIPEWARQAPNREAAAKALREAGIPGIKYLDQGSRAAGQGTRNYVVFDDSLVDILKKYGIVLPFAGAAAALGPELQTRK